MSTSSPKKRRRRTPNHCHHKARNLARVTIDGKDHYLGPTTPRRAKGFTGNSLADGLTDSRKGNNWSMPRFASAS